MNNWNYKSAKVCNELPIMKIDSISEITLSKYAEASGDYNPIHLDYNYAKKQLFNLKDQIVKRY